MRLELIESGPRPPVSRHDPAILGVFALRTETRWTVTRWGRSAHQRWRVLPPISRDDFARLRRLARSCWVDDRTTSRGRPRKAAMRRRAGHIGNHHRKEPCAMTDQVLRIDCKDQAPDIIDAVNKLIAPYGLKFVGDDLDHDGWIEYAFVVDDAALPIQSPE